MRFNPLRTVRGRMLLAALLVEFVMLGWLLSNSLRLLHEHMGQQAQSYAEQMVPVLKAALLAPLAQSDHATVQAVLDESTAVPGIDYLAVTDPDGRLIAASGWSVHDPLPAPDSEFQINPTENPPRYDVVQPIVVAGQSLGRLHFGLNLQRIIHARQTLLQQGVVIAGMELMLSAALLTWLGWLITRQLSVLTQASMVVAQGNSTPSPVPEGDDEVGRLGAAFNAMSRAVSDRIAQISQARDEAAQLLTAVEQEHARLATLLAAMDVGVLFTDSKDRVVYANDALRRQWGVAPDHVLVGAPLTMLQADFQQSLQPSDSWPYIQGRGAMQAELIHLDGRVLTVHCSPVVGAEDTGQIWLFADVTAERHIRQQLLAAKESAEAANVAKTAFLGTMSHEFRTPMNGIIGMTDLLADTALTDEQRGFLRAVRASADNLLYMVNDILDFTKIEAGQLVLDSTVFDPAVALDELVQSFQPQVQARHITLRLNTLVALPKSVKGDPNRLKQIVGHLLSNAIKFTHVGGVTLTIEACELQEGRWRSAFSVWDTGIGITPEKMASVFDLFTQTDGTSTRKYGGTGLGLTIVKRLVGLMGGAIRVQSEPDHGSTFSFDVYWDVAPAEPANPKVEPDRESDLHQGQGRILLVEDNLINQRVVQTILQKNGYSVVTAENGVLGVEAYCQQGPFDMVLMDMQMPEMDGLEATRQIRVHEVTTACGHTPIVALTANASEADRRACHDAGMDGFMAKPLRASELLGILKQLAV